MATKKETTNKKPATKKIVVAKEENKEISNVEEVKVEDPVNVEEPVKEEKITTVIEESKVEQVIEEKPEIDTVVEPNPNTYNDKIIKNTSSNFGYFWNGQMVDY